MIMTKFRGVTQSAPTQLYDETFVRLNLKKNILSVLRDIVSYVLNLNSVVYRLVFGRMRV